MATPSMHSAARWMRAATHLSGVAMGLIEAATGLCTVATRLIAAATHGLDQAAPRSGSPVAHMARWGAPYSERAEDDLERPAPIRQRSRGDGSKSIHSVTLA
jgi:hypothetical protein